MIVSKVLNFNDDLKEILNELALDNNYWASVEDFILDNECENFDELTPKQQNWIEKIKEDLDKEWDKRKLKHT